MSAALSFEPDEPQGSGLPGDAEEGIQQGLYVTLPAEELTLEGFAEDGRADTMAPGPLLAMVLGAVAGDDGKGLAGLSDDQLIGFLSGTRRMESRMAWAKMAALAELASRPRRQDFAADEVAAAFNVTWLSAAGEIDYARTVQRRRSPRPTGNSAGPRPGWCSSSTPKRCASGRRRRGGQHGCGRSGRSPATPGLPAGRCHRRRCWPPCSMSRIVPALSATPASPAPGKS